MVRQLEKIGSPVAKGLVEKLISEYKRGKYNLNENEANIRQLFIGTAYKR